MRRCRYAKLSSTDSGSSVGLSSDSSVISMVVFQSFVVCVHAFGCRWPCSRRVLPNRSCGASCMAPGAGRPSLWAPTGACATVSPPVPFGLMEMPPLERDRRHEHTCPTLGSDARATRRNPHRSKHKQPDGDGVHPYTDGRSRLPRRARVEGEDDQYGQQ